MAKPICGRSLGPNVDELCYREPGHSGKCYKTLGLEAEAIIQELLRKCGCYIVKATIHEDHKLGYDFLVYNKEADEINGNGSHNGDEHKNPENYLAVQFTIDSQAAAGEKGLRALRNGIFIFCAPVDDLKEWRDTTNSEVKEAIQWRIYRKFWEVIKAIFRKIPCFNPMRPRSKFDRFK